MAIKNYENWMMHYNELKAYVAVHRHFPDKHKIEFRGLLNWAKYTRKKIKAGTLPEEQRLLFEALEASRSDEHTGGRRKKIESGKSTLTLSNSDVTQKINNLQ